jgi:hypothetical protein
MTEYELVVTFAPAVVERDGRDDLVVPTRDPLRIPMKDLATAREHLAYRQDHPAEYPDDAEVWIESRTISAWKRLS